MTDFTTDGDARFTVTMKAHGGHDAAWVVVRANSNGELADLLDGFQQSGISTMIGGTVASLRAEESLGSILGARPVEHPGNYDQQNGAQQPASSGYARPAPATQAPAQASPYGQPPACPHGTKKHLEKPYKNGKPGTWKAWACPAPQGDPSACSLEFIR